MLLSACINTATIDVHTQEPAVVEERGVINEDGTALPDDSSIVVEPLPNTQPLSPVAAKLVDSARTQQREGRWDEAAGSLERALRIEPRNARLWSQLAEVRFEQRSWQQAIQMAAKSNTLAAQDQQVRRRNWYLMAEAYNSLGDQASAQRYRDKLLNR